MAQAGQWRAVSPLGAPGTPSLAWRMGRWLGVLLRRVRHSWFRNLVFRMNAAVSLGMLIGAVIAINLGWINGYRNDPPEVLLHGALGMLAGAVIAVVMAARWSKPWAGAGAGTERSLGPLARRRSGRRGRPGHRLCRPSSGAGACPPAGRRSAPGDRAGKWRVDERRGRDRLLCSKPSARCNPDRGTPRVGKDHRSRAPGGRVAPRARGPGARRARKGRACRRRGAARGRVRRERHSTSHAPRHLRPRPLGR